MKKKTIALFVSLLTFCVYFGIVFTMSSKSDPLDPGPNTSCNDPALTRSIAINFEPPSSANWARNPNFQGHIPSEDLRFGTNPALMLMIKDKWYAKVTVTSPQCQDFIYETVLTSSSNVVTIQVPPSQFDFYLEVVYWETYDAPYNPFDFNIPIGGTGTLSDAGRLVHVYEFLYLGPWNSGVTQPINLYPSHLVEDMDPWGGVGNSKPTGMGDYTDANDFITNRGN